MLCAWNSHKFPLCIIWCVCVCVFCILFFHFAFEHSVYCFNCIKRSSIVAYVGHFYESLMLCARFAECVHEVCTMEKYSLFQSAFYAPMKPHRHIHLAKYSLPFILSLVVPTTNTQNWCVCVCCSVVATIVAVCRRYTGLFHDGLVSNQSRCRIYTIFTLLDMMRFQTCEHTVGILFSFFILFHL